MGKESLSDGDGLKAQVAALTRDYVVEPHIGPLRTTAGCSPTCTLGKRTERSQCR